MLQIFYGRESIDKERFIFDNIDENALILVPDQFTLAAEKAALRFLKADGLMDIEVISMSRLGFRVLSELGGAKKDFVDKYGRHIVISDIMDRHGGELRVFRGMGEKSEFIDMACGIISELKQFNVTPQMLSELSEEDGRNALLSGKLHDIALIYSEYEKAIEGRYIDTDDYINLYLPKLPQSRLVKGRQIWIWGFDWVAPNTADVICALAECAQVRLVLTCDRKGKDAYVFDVTSGVIDVFARRCEKNGLEYSISQIGDKYVIPTGNGDEEKSIAIAELEKGLFRLPQEAAGAEAAEAAKRSVKLVGAANYYNEAESAAAYILWLLRAKGLRLRDIAVICNDTKTRGSIIKRVFAEYGIPIFVDEKKSLLHHPAVVFLTALIDAVSGGYRREDVLRLLKTGFTDIDADRIEKLENYAIKYKIRGNRWKSPFTAGTFEYTQEALAELEETRAEAARLLSDFEEAYKASRRAADRTDEIYGFLKDRAEMPRRLQAMIDELEEKELFAEAEEAAQVWQYTLAVLKQMKALMGETAMSLKRYETVLKAGFAAVEIGLLPPTADGLVMGTMQRSRTESVRALVVIGASEGLFPKPAAGGELLSEDEKLAVMPDGRPVLKLGDIQSKEEQLALYRCISTPREFLYMSYAASDNKSEKELPAMVFNDVKSFLKLAVSKGIDEASAAKAKLQAEESGLRYLAKELSDYKLSAETNPLESTWLESYKWYRENLPKQTAVIEKGLFYSNPQERLERDMVRLLYGDQNGELRVNPTSLERYSRCPFAHFITYGLSPDERRKFEVASREVGDIYHESLMRFSQSLTEPDVKVSDENSKWQTITRAESDELLCREFDMAAAGYRDGIASSGKEEEYRIKRIRDILCENAWALVGHVRAGRIKTIAFEEKFGKGAKLPALEIPCSGGSVRIEGKIDRIDYLEGGTVKIIDYKSGKDSIKPAEAVQGWRLQLMLYLKAALNERSDGGEKPAPAGVFYFNIKDSETKGDGLTADVLKAKCAEALKEYKLQGILVDYPDVIKDVAGSFSGWSDVISGLRCSGDDEKGYTFSGSNLMGIDEFTEFSEEFDREIESLCEELTSGSITAHPKKKKETSACEYCGYKGICRFDTALDECRYERISC